MPKQQLVYGLRRKHQQEDVRSIVNSKESCGEQMDLAELSMTDSMQHRGCGIRAASYSVGPQSWLPEACVCLETETGLCRLWVRSFAHCFDAEKLIFPNKSDADSWALGAARAIIDRALEQLTTAISPVTAEPAKAPLGRWRLAGSSSRLFERLKRFPSSH